MQGPPCIWHPSGRYFPLYPVSTLSTASNQDDSLSNSILESHIVFTKYCSNRISMKDLCWLLFASFLQKVESVGAPLSLLLFGILAPSPNRFQLYQSEGIVLCQILFRPSGRIIVTLSTTFAICPSDKTRCARSCLYYHGA